MKNNKPICFLFLLYFFNNFVFAQNMDPQDKELTQGIKSTLHSDIFAEEKESHKAPVKKIITHEPEVRETFNKNDEIMNGFGGHVNNTQPSISLGEIIIKVVVGLGFVLMIIGLLAWLSNKIGINRLANNKKIRLRESISLSSKEKLVIVDFAGESLLLGVGGGKVTLLKSVPQLSLMQAQEDKSSLGAKNALDFQHKLNAFLLKGSQS